MNKADALLLIDTLAHDPTYGCYSRQGLELVAWPNVAKKARFVIFADIDDMHALNSTHGYTAVDQKIRDALRVRASDVAAVGRWYSGDELVWVITEGDPEGMIRRIQADLARHGLTATFAFAPVRQKNLSMSVNLAAAQVQAAKGQRGRHDKG